ncbi:MAG: SoxR reducing system RseC family protein [Lysobacterales bacterium]
MLEQQGQVVAVADGRVSVRLGGQSGCAACDAGQGCGAGVFGKLLRRRPLILEFGNHLDAHSGQAVVVGVPEAWFLRLVARFYLLPLLAGLGGAGFGHYLSVRLQSGPSGRDILALAGGIAAGAAAVWWNRNRPVKIAHAFTVHLLRVAHNTEFESN